MKEFFAAIVGLLAVFVGLILLGIAGAVVVRGFEIGWNWLH